MDIIAAGRTLFIKDGPVPHLWVVLTDPDPKTDSVVAVMLRTQRAFTDPTVILDVGEHQFIRHASAVDYSSATFFRTSKILNNLTRNTIILREDVSRNLLKKIRGGLLESPFTVNAIKDYCAKHFT